MSGLAPPVGRFDVWIEGRLWYLSEADLRDGLAAKAWLCGWDVATEVPVPNGGRADVVLTDPTGHRVVVEVKKELRTVGQARPAFQQADGYARFFTGADVFLTAPKMEREGFAALDNAYPEVECVPLGALLHRIVWLQDWRTRDAEPVGRRLAAALRREREAQRVASLASDTTRQLAEHHRSVLLRRLAVNYPAWAQTLTDALEQAA